MILVGLGSAWINIRYHFYHISPFGLPVDGPFNAASPSTSTSIEEAPVKRVEIPRSKLSTGGAKYTPKPKKGRKTFDGELSGGQLVKKDKDGKALVKVITSLNAEDLGDIAGGEGVDPSLTLEEAVKGREPIMEILKEAGITDFDAATVAKLPTWDEVEALYGKGPVVYGLDTCEAFRKSIPPEEASIASAGIFNRYEAHPRQLDLHFSILPS